MSKSMNGRNGRPYELKELIDIPKLQELTDELYDAAGIPSAIITMTGEILTGSGWQRICTEFHRRHPEMERACIASDIAIREQLDAGEPFAIYSCPFGLTDASIPIVIEGEHLANAFAGQLFMTPPDPGAERRFREQARAHGLDEEAYVGAYREIPVIPEERFRPALRFLGKLAEMIAALGLQRKRELEALARLRESEAMLSTIDDNLPDAYTFQLTYDEGDQPRFLFVSGGVERIHGITREAAVTVPSPLHGQTPSEAVADLRNEEMQSKLHLLDFTRDLPFRHPSGELRWLHIRSRPRMTPEGRVIWDGVATDITDRRRAEDALAAKTEELDRYFKTSLDLLCVASLDGRFLRLNPEWERVLGCPLDDLLGHSFLDLVHPEDVDATRAAMAALEREEEVAGFTNRYRCKSGSYRWIEWRARVLGDTIYATARDVTERRAAEESLRAREEIFSSIVGAAADGIVLVDAETQRFVEFNEAAHRELGYSREEFARLTLEDVTEHTATDREQAFARLAAGETESFEVRHRTKGGETRATHVRSRGIELRGRRYAAAIWTDITERLKAEAALLDLKVRIGSQELYSVLVEMAGEGFWLLDKDFRTVYVNPAIETMLGYSKAEMAGRSWYDFGDPEWVARAQELERRRQDGIAEPHTFLFVRKDGSRMLARVATTPLHDETGAFNGALGILSDITRQKEAEEALEVKDVLSKIAQSSGLGMFLLEPDYTISWYNDIFARRYGPLAQTRGRNCFEVFEGREAVCPGCPAQESFDTGAVASSERTSVRNRLGKERVLAVTTSPIHDHAGSVVQVVGVAQDVTQARHAEAEHLRLQMELHHAQKMESIGRLAGGVAHDFNNLLTSIMGNLSLALDGLEDDDARSGPLRDATDAALSAADLTRRLLTFSRKQLIEPRVLDLNRVVEDSEKMIRRLIGEDIILASELGIGLGAVLADRGQVEQILVNLVVNARDAMPTGGRLVVRTANVTLTEEFRAARPWARTGPHVMLSVSDEGGGMSDEVKKHLFEPFFTTKGVGRGTGLGLATVYGAVKQSGGIIDVASEAGKGTTVEIYLPRVESQPEAPAADPHERLPRGDETILLVEDEEMVRSLTVRVLERQGYTVLSYSEPVEALAALRRLEAPLHLLITDVVMPGMNGKALSDEARKARPGLKVLFISGYARDVLGRHGVLEESEGAAFIGKPYSPLALAKKVRAILDA